MHKCDYALLNVFLTVTTAIIESTQAKNKQEVFVIVLRRFGENKTIPSIIECVPKKKCVCG